MTLNKKLSEKEIKHLAKLSFLGISEKEAVKLEKDIASILEFVGQLESVNANEVKPTAQTTGLENILRDDLVIESISQENALSQTKSKHDGYFKTKAI
ncbi:MAG: Asp-tRNA(Asn)/Glu-tRNA(Gln) amidotransferase subunit GatC, partial [Patescibacteria group bacterium]